MIKGDVIKGIADFLLLLAHLKSLISFVFVIQVFEKHIHINYIFKSITSPPLGNIDVIIPLPFPFQQAAEIKPTQLDVTFWLREMRFPPLPSTSPVVNWIISKVLSSPTSQQSQCL